MTNANLKILIAFRHYKNIFFLDDKYTKIQHAHTTLRIEKDEINQLIGTLAKLKSQCLLVNDK